MLKCKKRRTNRISFYKPRVKWNDNKMVGITVIPDTENGMVLINQGYSSRA